VIKVVARSTLLKNYLLDIRSYNMYAVL